MTTDTTNIDQSTNAQGKEWDITKSSSMTAYKDRIIHSTSEGYTDISMDAVDAVEFRRELWNLLMILGAILGLLGLLGIIGGDGSAGFLLALIGSSIFGLGYFRREEEIVIVTPGKEFSYETKNSQNGKEAADTICTLRDEYKGN
ncbi:hypothetical protein OB919_07745 [Halobacteria archaeon AArc-curdl1]|uniref:Uncharacterized protein n=1 Tax=Natronosalvus hydrolyticus TaxID=2979988 RepID=A0AAP2Z6Z5_9EURY|nr:hypothetical protein [Halobacteria archaeon AArc-curdl1]